MELRPTEGIGADAEGGGREAGGRTWLAGESTLADTIAGAPGDFGGGPHRSRKDVLQRGAHVGRYMILEWVGEGGMGVVYAAYDPQLDRKVALKLVLGASPELASSRRLLREAQALARLAHPNVVSVHDVGEVDGQLFIAMEFVEGQTLGVWAEAERSVDERLAVLRAAGRGLAAAHAGDLLHRDFKPENVMVGDDGRVRVMDFGLARSVNSPEGFEAALEGFEAQGVGGRRSIEAVRAATASVPVAAAKVSALATNMTRTGAMMGTPAFMAPELFLNGKSDARSDQYAFFVVAFEVLFGEHPYPMKNLAQLIDRAAEGASVTVPADLRVPGGVRRAIERGLSANPEERFADMEEALLALREPREGRAGRRASAVGVVALIAGLSAFSWLSAAGTADPCAAAAEAATRSWDERAQASIRAAFEATEAPFAIPTGERAIEALDRVGSSHAALRRRVCEATHVEATQSAALLDRRMECLDARRLRFESMISVLAQADVEVAKNAIEAVSQLPPASECMLITSGEELRPPPPPEQEAEVTRVRQVIARSHAELDAGAPTVALRGLHDEEEAVAKVDYLPLRAEFAHARAVALWETKSGSMTEEFVGALALALELGDDELSFSNLGDLITAAVLAEDWEASKHWLTLLQAVVARRGDRLADRITVERKTARVKRVSGNRRAAHEHIERALELQRELDPGDTLALGGLHRDAGNNYIALGQMTEAERSFEEALVAYRGHLGEDHPSLAGIYLGLGQVARTRGDPEGAIASLERGIAMMRRAYGSESHALGNLYTELAVVFTSLRRFDEAEDYFQRVLGFYKGEPSFALPYNTTLGNYGAMLWFAGRYEDAVVPQRELLRLYLDNPDAPPFAIGIAEGNLASTLSSLGRHAESLELHRSAQTRFESVLSRDDPTLAVAYFDQSKALLALERYDEALAVLERAESIYVGKGSDGDPAQLADVRVTMVEALRPEEVGAHRERAEALAEAVFAARTEHGPRTASLVERLQAAGIDVPAGLGQETSSP